MRDNPKAQALIDLCTEGWSDHHFTIRDCYACSKAHAVLDTLQYYSTIADRMEKEGLTRQDFSARGINVPEGYSTKDFNDAVDLFMFERHQDAGILKHLSMYEVAA